MRKGGSEEDDGLALAVRVGYGLMALALSSVHNVFLIYHVDAYVNVFGISFNGFWIAEFLFLLYNSFNDVIWGMLADSQMDTSRVDAKGLTLRIRYRTVNLFFKNYFILSVSCDQSLIDLFM